MEVWRDTVVVSEEFDKVLGDVERLNGAEAQAFDGGLGHDAPEQFEEVDAWDKVASVGTKIDSAENDLPESGVGQPLKFAQDYGQGQATGTPPDERNHTKRTAGIAAVLNL